MNPTTTSARIVGRYALYGVLASGGMATVHFGRLIGPVGFSRTVAIKRLHPQYAADPEFVAMFLDEARLAARIRHPNVIPTLDVVATSGELFLVMEYVPGESLARLVRAARGRGAIMPPSITVAILVGVLHGLHAAHEARNEHGAPLGIVHRDVSPQNVLVGADGQARVLDFGVAKAAGRVQTTREGQLKGKLAYMAPEQLRGETCTRQTDLYAAAVVLWEALSGERLFKADNEGAVVNRVLEGARVPPSQTATPMLDAATQEKVAHLDAIVMRALARDPAARFATAREMALALEKALAPSTASQVSEWIENIASDVLLLRAAQIADIESSSAAAPAPFGLPAPAPARQPAASGRGAPASIDPISQGQDTHSAAGLSSVSVAANKPVPKDAPPSRRRRMALALAVGAVLLVPGIAVWLLHSRAPEPTTAPPAEAESATAAAAAPGSAGATAGAPSPSAAARGEGAEEGSPPSPSATPTAAAASRPPRATPAAPAQEGHGAKKAPRTTGCNPPFTYDGAGMKHYKPECL